MRAFVRHTTHTTTTHTHVGWHEFSQIKPGRACAQWHHRFSVSSSVTHDRSLPYGVFARLVLVWLVVTCNLSDSAAGFGPSPIKQRPHILLILADDLGWNDVRVSLS